jgi:DHA1 family inner membrane transport protein
MALATAELPRKAALVALMGIFIVGNLLCAVASDYNVLMFARVVTALCHGAFFGIGSVVAAGLVPANRRIGRGADVHRPDPGQRLGVPLGTALGPGSRLAFDLLGGDRHRCGRADRPDALPAGQER